MEDMMGKPLDVGTKVLYIRNGKTSYSVHKLTVTSFTSQMVRVSGNRYITGAVNPSSLIAYDWED